MNCPICNDVISPAGYVHYHIISPYRVCYDYDDWDKMKPFTSIYFHHGDFIMTIDGFVKLDKARIEKLILLK